MYLLCLFLPIVLFNFQQQTIEAIFLQEWQTETENVTNYGFPLLLIPRGFSKKQEATSGFQPRSQGLLVFQDGGNLVPRVLVTLVQRWSADRDDFEHCNFKTEKTSYTTLLVVNLSVAYANPIFK